MTRLLLTSCFLLFSTLYLRAADNYPVGARSAALGNASVTFADVWSSMHNQAGLAFLKSSVAGVNYEDKFLISNLSIKSFAFAIPVSKAGVFSVNATQYGYSLYNEKKVGLGFGKKLSDKFAVGVQLDYLSTYFGDEYYGSRNAFAVEIGMLAEPMKNLKIGFHIFNPSRAKLAEYGDERIPVIAKFGVSYQFSEKVLLSVEEEKDIDFKGAFKAGLEYRVADPFYLRCGIENVASLSNSTDTGSNPSLLSFGIGLKLGDFMFDASSSYHQVLGFTPQFGLIYKFK